MKKACLAATLLGLLVLAPIAAFADTCVSTTNTGIFVEVCYTVTDNLNGTFTLATTDINGLDGFDIKAIDGLGWDSSAYPLSTTSNGSWFPVGSNPNHLSVDQNIDGFDPNDWQFFWNGTGNVNNDGLSTWTFTGEPTDLIFHVQYTNLETGTGCSAWVTGRDHPPVTPPTNNNCGGGEEVPEPASLTLLGTGLLGLGGMLRKKLGKKKS